MTNRTVTSFGVRYTDSGFIIRVYFDGHIQFDNTNKPNHKISSFSISETKHEIWLQDCPG